MRGFSVAIAASAATHQHARARHTPPRKPGEHGKERERAEESLPENQLERG